MGNTSHHMIRRTTVDEQKNGRGRRDGRECVLVAMPIE